MELLVVTLAYTTPTKDVDTLARIQLINDTLRNAQGLVTSRFYRGRGSSPCYAMLTTWEDEETWKRAQERYNPKQLLSSSAAELLVSLPEQWLFTYLWGYSRPAASPALAAIHFATVRSEQADVVQRGWIEGLRRQTAQPTLAFAFLARGIHKQLSPISLTEENATRIQGALFLNLLSWASEEDREDFYADPNYKAVNRFINGMGTIQIFSLEPL
ncbi:MAG: hypothetical protein NVS4B11_02010 [Ktedonobacteraceae bacterium]